MASRRFLFHNYRYSEDQCPHGIRKETGYAINTFEDRLVINSGTWYSSDIADWLIISPMQADVRPFKSSSPVPNQYRSLNRYFFGMGGYGLNQNH